MSTLFSIALTLFFVMDALGVIPVYLRFVDKLPRRRQLWIAVRELLFALIIMMVFHFVGEGLLQMLEVSTTSVQISGGLIMFLIAIRLIFPSDEDEEPVKWAGEEPFIVPLATPLIAGPMVLAVIMIYAREQSSHFIVLGAIFLAWLASAFVFFLARPIKKLIKDRGLLACKRLMGLILALIAVQMLLQGVQGYIK